MNGCRTQTYTYTYTHICGENTAIIQQQKKKVTDRKRDKKNEYPTHICMAENKCVQAKMQFEIVYLQKCIIILCNL